MDRLAALLAPICLALSFANGAAAGDWPTFGYDPARTGWARSERTLGLENVGNLELKWKAEVDDESEYLVSLTAPVVGTGVSTRLGVRDVVYVAGKQGGVFALDSATGEQLWDWKPTLYQLPTNNGLQGSVYCPNGVNATPTLDVRSGILYTIAESGALWGLDMGSGKVRYGPVQFVPAFSKNWSLNLVGDTIYTTLAQGCGGSLSGFYSIDISDRHGPVVRQRLLSNTSTGGIWGRGGPVVGENGRVYGSTADGPFDVRAGDYSNAVVAASLDDLSLVDYFLPRNHWELYELDLDFGAASPVWFGWKGYNILAAGAKEGVIYLLDADLLGGRDHQTPLLEGIRLGNDPKDIGSYGIWGGLSTWADEQGRRWVYVPVYGPPSKQAPAFPRSHGPITDGSVMAFEVTANPGTGSPELTPAWISSNLKVPEPVALANGVAFVLANGENTEQRTSVQERQTKNTQPAVLHALDARTGDELYNSGDAMGTWVHFSGLAIAEGQVYTVDYDSVVYCFGLKGK